MPRVEVTGFEVARVAPGHLHEFVRVKATVTFTATEIRLNVPCTVLTELWEVDDGMDHFIAATQRFSFPMTPIVSGDADDRVRRLPPQVVRPDGRSTVTVIIQETFDIGDQESGDEEYRAVVFVIPEIRADVAMSNQVIANLG
jgi:hypothetical protein